MLRLVVSPLTFFPLPLKTTPPRLLRTASLKTTLVQRGSNDPLPWPDDDNNGAAGTYKMREVEESGGERRGTKDEERQEVRCVLCPLSVFIPLTILVPYGEPFLLHNHAFRSRKMRSSLPTDDVSTHWRRTPRRSRRRWCREGPMTLSHGQTMTGTTQRREEG